MLGPGCVHTLTGRPHVQDVSPQQEPEAENSTADDSQLTQPVDSHFEEVSTAARASDACLARKRKAGALQPEETAGNTSKQSTRTSSVLGCAATCSPGEHATSLLPRIAIHFAQPLNVLCMTVCTAPTSKITLYRLSGLGDNGQEEVARACP